MNIVNRFTGYAFFLSTFFLSDGVIFASGQKSEEMDKVAIVSVDTQIDFAATEDAKKYHEKQMQNDLFLGKMILLKYTYGLPVDGANEDFFKQEASVLAWGRNNKLTVIRTGDDHPKNSVTFARTHGAAEFSTVEVEGVVHNTKGTVTKVRKPQTVWPVHCVSGTPGAEWVNRPQWSLLAATPFFKRWAKYKNDIVQRKGQTNEAYSAVLDTYGNDLGLVKKLNDNKIGAVIIGGLAGGHCVCSTALDLAKHGKKEVAYVLNHTRWLQGTANNVPAYKDGLVAKIREMRDAGVKFYVVQEGSVDWAQRAFVEDLCKEAKAEIRTVATMHELHSELVAKLQQQKANALAKK